MTELMEKILPNVGGVKTEEASFSEHKDEQQQLILGSLMCRAM